MEDKDILALLWNRVEQAISAMVERYGRRLHLTAANLLHDQQDAEECVSDTYMAVWDAIPPKRPNCLSAYVYRTGRNIALNKLRARTTQKRGGYELSLDELEGCIPAPCMENSMELGQALNQYLSTLNKDTRAIFLRRFWFGDSVKDIAKDFSMTESAISVRLNRAKAGLRSYLKKEGYHE
ncbi:MAG: sigma-70 family RNA polymerase sigma factor [Ruminococcaceae bacterium]|nr:sigma-70 family RNA polymerase sigma factor [Oscillospiraceae bacterium]MBQ3215437.1 sigma-70 family RNA polymerase sigma factor [Oscillospiraceae bacterium]